MATAWRLRPPPPRAQSLRDYRVAVWLDDPVAPPDSAVLDVLAAEVSALGQADAQIDDTARPVELAEADAVFDKLFQAAVSPGAADWNVTNERRQQLRAAAGTSSAHSTYS